MRILVVEDERKVARFLERGLKEEGFVVDVAHDGEEGLRKALENGYDLIALDVLMPKKDGFQTLAELRAANCKSRVIMLTARDSVNDRVHGLETGADDYLTKPFEPRELSLRIASILRRVAPVPAAATPQVIRFGPFLFHVDRGELRNGEEQVRLTERERSILQTLARSSGEPVSREELAGGMDSTNERTVDVHINRLRRKLERDPANPQYLQTARGSGYRIVIET